MKLGVSITIHIKMVNLTISIAMRNDSAANSNDKMMSYPLKLLVDRDYQIDGMNVIWMSSFKMRRRRRGAVNIYMNEKCRTS